MTKYKILSHGPAANPDEWYEKPGEYEGANDEAAIKAFLLSKNGASDPSGEYVAVPLRSWKPRKVETKQAFSFS